MGQAFNRVLREKITRWFGLSKNFLLVWAGQTISIFGDVVGGMALNIYILQTTGSASAMSFNMFLSLMPRLIAGPVAGVILDRTDRKKGMVVCDVIQGVTTLAVAWMLFTGSLGLVHIYLWTVIGSVVRMYYEPATYAIIPSLVDKEAIQQANAMQSTGRSMANVFGPAVAGFAFGLFGPWIAMFLDALTFWVSAVCISAAHTRREPKGAAYSESHKSSGVEAFREGLAFFGRNRLALYLLVMTVIINMAMLPSGIALQYHLINTLQASPELYGITWSASSAATLASSVVLVSRKRWNRQSLMLFTGTAGMGAAMVLAAATRKAVLIPIVWTIYGFASPLLGVAVSTLYQEITPAELRGRVFSIRTTVSTALAPFSSLMVGPLLDSVGSIPTLTGLGLILLATAIWIFATKEFRSRDVIAAEV